MHQLTHLLARFTLIGFLLLLSALPAVAATDFSEQQDLLHARYERTTRLLRDGKLDEALTQALRALELARKLYGKDSAGTAPALDRIGAVHRAAGDLQRAEAVLRQALELVRRELGTGHRFTVSALNNLAGLYKEMGRYGEAERHYLQAIEIQRGLPDGGPEEETGLLHNLAVLYMNTARYADAEPLLRKAVDLAEQATRRDRLDERMNISRDRQQLEWGRSIGNLANLYFTMKRYEEAETLTLQSLAIFRRILGEEHPEVARIKADLGELYSASGKGALAEKMLTEAINTALAVYGSAPQPAVADYYVNLARLYEGQEHYQEALRFAQHGLEILQQTVGRKNPKALRCLNIMAVIHLNLGNYRKAELLLREVVESASATVGQDHQLVAAALSNLASSLASQGSHPEANRLMAAALAINERRRENAFLVLSEQQKLNYVGSMLYEVQLYLAHLLRYGPFDPPALATAFNTWIRWKGSVSEAQGRYVEALYRSEDPALQHRYDELARVQRDLARVELASDRDSLRTAGGSLAELRKRKGELEAELSRLSRNFALERQIGTVSVEMLVPLLPKDAVYIDFAGLPGRDFLSQEPQKPRYAAFVLAPGVEPPVRLIDLGDRETIDRLVRDYLQEMRRKAEARPDHDPQRLVRAAAALYRAVFKPLVPLLGGRTNLYLSPDGALNLVPFEVLKGEETRFVAEEYQITYTGSGRDLVRSAGTAPPAMRTATIIADPDFEMEKRSAGPAAIRGGLSGDFSGIRFAQLPDTRAEADALTAILSAAGTKTSTFLGREATEQALFSSRNPGILHLATHGFCLQGGSDGGGGTRGLKRVARPGGQDDRPERVENPMLRSGIVLAGANRSLATGSDEGLVSAEKILGLRLRGTELVTLSACETAVGEVLTGEGVFGLKRAFLLSGARTLVMSLWSVPSVETTRLMTEFYRLMARGVPKGQALREARLHLMRQQPHPFYWGAFIMIGQPD